MPKWLHLLQPAQVWSLKESDSIYASGKSPYQFNVNHPLVAKRYEEYRKEIGAENFPVDESLRMEFERRINCGEYPELAKRLRGETNVHMP